MIEEPMPETYFVTAEDTCCTDACVYCKRGVGDTHELECVCRTKQVWVRLIIEYPTIVPASWTEDEILDYRNEGSYCNVNALDEIAYIAGLSDEENELEVDLCEFSWFEIVEEPRQPPPVRGPQLDLDRLP